MHHKMRLALENNKRISFENMLSIGVQKGIFGSSIERVGLFDTDADGQTLLHFAAKRGWLKSFLDAVMGDDVYKICIREGAAIDRTSPEDQKAAARKYILKFLLKPTIIPKAPSNNLDTTASDNAPIIPNDTTALDIELNNGKYETFVYINDKFSELWRPSSRLSNKFHMIVKTAAEAKIRALADPQEVAAILEAQAQDPNESLVVVRPDTPPQKDTVELFIKLFENNYISILNEEEKFEIMQKLVRLLNVVSLHDNEYWKIHPGQLQAIINHDGRGSIVDATKKYILRVAALASLNGTLETFELDNFLPALIPLLDHEGKPRLGPSGEPLKTRILSEELEEKLEQYVLEGKYEDGANPLAPSPSQQAESYNAASAASAQPNKKVEISDNIEQIPPAEASVAPDLSLDAKQSQLPMAAAAAPIKAKPKNNPSSRGSNDGVDKKIQKVINWVKKALATEDFQNLSKDLGETPQDLHTIILFSTRAEEYFIESILSDKFSYEAFIQAYTDTLDSEALRALNVKNLDAFGIAASVDNLLWAKALTDRAHALGEDEFDAQYFDYLYKTSIKYKAEKVLEHLLGNQPPQDWYKILHFALRYADTSMINKYITSDIGAIDHSDVGRKHTHYTEHYTLLNLGLKYVKDLFKATTPTSEATTQLPKAQYQGYANKAIDTLHILCELINSGKIYYGEGSHDVMSTAFRIMQSIQNKYYPQDRIMQEEYERFETLLLKKYFERIPTESSFHPSLISLQEHNAPDDTSTGSVDTQGSAFSGFSDEEYKFTGAATGYTDA